MTYLAMVVRGNPCCGYFGESGLGKVVEVIGEIKAFGICQKCAAPFFNVTACQVTYDEGYLKSTLKRLPPPEEHTTRELIKEDSLT